MLVCHFVAIRATAEAKWVPGHANININEVTDKLAKQEALAKPFGQHTATVSSAKHHFKTLHRNINKSLKIGNKKNQEEKHLKQSQRTSLWASSATRAEQQCI